MLTSAWQYIRARWFLFLSLFIIAFMTWVPKIPLFEIIPGYIVRARVEDILVAIGLIIFLVQVVRGKATLRSPITIIFIYYAIVGVLSMLSAMYVVQTVPINVLHVGKMFLHYARRLEYFSIFYLFYAGIKGIKDIRVVLTGLVVIMIGITVYGFGQRYLYWPVYSTMNREFSKGVRLVLTEHARVPSTFGGHYDMAAFAMFVLTIILATFFFTKKWWVKLPLLLVYAAGFWLLILAASRSSFLAYLLSIGTLIVLIGIYKRSWWWTITRGVVVLFLSLAVMVSFGDLSSRFTQLGFIQQINSRFASLLKPVGKQPEGSIAVEPLDKTDQLPIPSSTTQKPAPTPAAAKTPSVGRATPHPRATPQPRATPLPPDVFVNVPDLKVVIATVGGKQVKQVVEVPRTYSACTYQYGLSACIRFDTLWPRAIRGFLRNPLLGSGYSTLTKGSKDEFTEAESTDNDFLRNTGETGILGIIGFYGSIFVLFWYVIRALQKNIQPLVTAFLLSMVAGSLGLFFNGLYIDVFEASKVAFLYWSLMGVAFGLLKFLPGKNEAALT